MWIDTFASDIKVTIIKTKVICRSQLLMKIFRHHQANFIPEAGLRSQGSSMSVHAET